MRSERDVKKKVKALFDKWSWFWWCPPANGYGASGISDFHALKHHVFMVVETKFGSNKPTALQKGFLNTIQSEGCGGYAFVVNDKNWPFLEGFLESFEIATQCQSRNEEVPAEHGARMLNAIKVLTDY